MFYSLTFASYCLLILDCLFYFRGASGIPVLGDSETFGFLCVRNVCIDQTCCSTYTQFRTKVFGRKILVEFANMFEISETMSNNSNNNWTPHYFVIQSHQTKAGKQKHNISVFWVCLYIYHNKTILCMSLEQSFSKSIFCMFYLI